MILTLKANYEEKKEAIAKAEARGKAEGITEGIAQGEARGEAAAEAAAAARIQEWYEAHRHDLVNAPPPPYTNGYRNAAGDPPHPPRKE